MNSKHKTLVSGSAAAVAGGANTGNGTMGSITVSSHAKVGQYVLRITVASSNAGAFELLNSNGSVVGTGNVASAFVGAGLAFTLADGAADFIVGDTFVITVTGTEKYKILENTASDGSAAFAGIYIGASNGLGIDTSVAATTDTTVLILERGPALVAKEGLTLGASINTAADQAQLALRRRFDPGKGGGGDGAHLDTAGSADQQQPHDRAQGIGQLREQSEERPGGRTVHHCHDAEEDTDPEDHAAGHQLQKHRPHPGGACHRETKPHPRLSR